MPETRVLDKIFFAYKTRCSAFLGFILSKTRTLDMINFLAYKYRYLEKGLSYYPIWVVDSDKINFFLGGGSERVKPKNA